MVVRRSNQRTLQALLAVATLAFLGVLVVHFAESPPEQTVTRFSFAPEGLTHTRISPDGKYILYTAQTDGESSLWLRPLGDESARHLAGTEGAIGGFWSPDSSWIGFGTATELKRVSIDGGSPITLCELQTTGFFPFLGGTWSPDDERIVFSSDLRLYDVAARGGQPELLFDPSDSPRRVSVYPHFLPTGSGPAALVYVAATSPADSWVAVLNLETGERRELGPGRRPVYSQDGYLIHGPTDSTEPGLWAWPFSLATLEPIGDAFPISTAGRAATLSHDGTLAYRDQAEIASTRTLAWRDRTGELLETLGQPQNMAQPSLSPDGQRVAVRSNESGNFDVWVHDLIRSTKIRVTFEDVNEAHPAWSPSGQEIAYRQVDVGPGDSLMRKSADGTGEAVVLVESESDLHWPDWSHDGRYLVYSEENSETGRDIRYVELGSDGAASEPVTFLSTPANEDRPQLSPDGRFLAYVSTESGRNEIYVQPFPDGPGKWPVSVNGGDQIRWSSDGSELFYAEGLTLMAVSVSTEQGFTLGQPQALFASPGLTLGGGRSYDVSADGQRFVMTMAVGDGDEEAAPPSIRVVQNWYEEFRDREQD